MNIVLCGMMGSGKTTVAAAINRKYGLEVVDTDTEIVRRYGEISAIFASRGEEYFRDLESEAVRQAAKRDGIVISLGGGCVLRQGNVEELKRTGRIFYLRARAETVIARIQGDTSRPLLQGNLEERVHSILAARSAIYEKAADIVIDTDDKTPEQLADIIVSEI